MNAVLFNPAGVAQPDRIVAPRVSYAKLHLDRIDLSVPDFADIRDSRQLVSNAAMSLVVGVNYTGGKAPQRIQSAAVSSEWFDVFGARPIVGRAFRPEDDQPGSNQVVVLSFNLWNRMFGGQNSAVGQTVELDRKPYRIVGVMRADFRWPREADIWIPLGLSRQAYASTHRFDEFYTTVARLKPGVSLAQFQQYMHVLTEQVKASDKSVRGFANDAQWSMVAEPFTELISGDLRLPLFILAASVGLVLLIACSNIAGLMLVRGSGRTRELAIRRVLGARTSDLIWQAMTEVILLASAGTLLGLLSIPILLKTLLWITPLRMSAGLVIEPGTPVGLFTIGAGALSCLFFGIVPAWQAAQLGEAYASLREGDRSSTIGASRQRLRGALVIGQIALALILVSGTGVLLNSLSRIRSAKLGFDGSHVMTAAVELPDSGYSKNEKQVALFQSVLADLRGNPGVVSAAAAKPVPFSGDHWTGSFQIQGRPELPGDPGPHGYRGFVSPNYFEALRIPLLAGRVFTEADGQGSHPVVIVDINLAKTYWPGKDPIGQAIRNDDNSPWATVIGVVGHVRAYSFSPGDTRGIYYMPVYQQPAADMNFVVRMAGDPSLAATLIERSVHRFDSSIAVFDVVTPAQRISSMLGPQQFTAQLLTAFACAALLLSSLGLYGVVTFGAGQRTKEIGIRCALGATRGQITLLVAGQGLRLTATGLLIGSALAVVTVHSVATQIENISLDALTFCGAIALLSVIACSAAVVPAWRSATMNVVQALRSE